ncbi:hypothetical protein HS088_TW05G00351 [Tripterygium wilfordii]|uniref:HTH myb-type domain-containing protein n=2 Tax=Tripterygium wilfordii TaxID=458696 RepID=A0A7J7DMN8_TRIWF|nr:hypothetical protein HS088_TW05G00351 [Tripterygium wilfordii]
MTSSCSDGSRKERLRWTEELHDRFEEAVNRLGGPEMATPKGIWKAMAIPGLTIYHVKSHLQKYRIMKLIPESGPRSKFERRHISELFPNFGATCFTEQKEALLLQMEVQRRLNDHTEVQRSLKLKLEAQERFFDRVAEEHRNRASIAKSIKPLSPASLPALCEYSDSNGKEFECDSEIVKNEIRHERRISGSLQG